VPVGPDALGLGLGDADTDIDADADADAEAPLAQDTPLSAKSVGAALVPE
jgi:hypothetical protein